MKIHHRLVRFFFSCEASKKSEKTGKRWTKHPSKTKTVREGKSHRLAPSENLLSGLSAVGKCCLQASVLYGASAVLRAFVLTGSVWKPVVLIHCEETFCRSCSQDSTADEVVCPKRAILIRLATQQISETVKINYLTYNYNIFEKFQIFKINFPEI